MYIFEYLVERFFKFLRSSARYQSAVQDGAGLTFGICTGIKVLVAIAGVGLSGLAIIVLLVTKGEKGPPVAVLIPVSLLVVILFSLPPSIVLDEAGIRQRYWWGRCRQIPWGDVTSAFHDPLSGSTTILYKWGKISFSQNLVDQGRFDREVRAHMRPDFWNLPVS
ncbi:MAG: hypothetical protein ACE145_09085 [Terriglobia bacterium]